MTQGMTGHTGFREPILKKNHGQIYIKHIGENNGLLSMFFFFKESLGFISER